MTKRGLCITRLCVSLPALLSLCQRKLLHLLSGAVMAAACVNGLGKPVHVFGVESSRYAMRFRLYARRTRFCLKRSQVGGST
ncbi:MAG: hypothetical protein P8176_09670 [Gammaproteobacteria bacterium]